jgi:hypothetical protein
MASMNERHLKVESQLYQFQHKMVDALERPPKEPSPKS